MAKNNKNKGSNNKIFNNIIKKCENTKEVSGSALRDAFRYLSTIDDTNPDIYARVQRLCAYLAMEENRIRGGSDSIIEIMHEFEKIKNEVENEKLIKKRKYFRWTQEHNATLLRMKKSGKNWDLISQAVDHSIESCKTQYRKIKTH